MIRATDQDEAACVRSLRHVDVRTILTSLTSNWQRKAFALTASVQAHQLRAVPDDLSVGMKVITYCKWFGQGQAAGSLYALNRLQHIRIVAALRMSFHKLNIETGRHGRGAHRVMCANRFCRCCDTNAREDELHIFECAAYAGLRAQFSDIVSELPVNDLDVWMRRTMNPVGQRSWQRLADFLIMVMAVRERTLAELA